MADIIDELNEYVETKLFSPDEYDVFVIIPNNCEVRKDIKETFKKFVKDITISLDRGYDKREIMKLLKNALKKFNKFIFDTEDKEFVCHCFARISKILDMDFGNELNKWLYGRTLNLLLKLGDYLKK